MCPSYLPLAETCEEMGIMFGVIYKRRSSMITGEIHVPVVETQGSIRSGENLSLYLCYIIWGLKVVL
jgi:hypothetical protein